jgi:hypothetical protein
VLPNPLGYQTQYKYDANGNQTCTIDANGFSLVTDPGHQPLNIDGCTESRSYDELNRVTQTKDAQNICTCSGFGTSLSVTVHQTVVYEMGKIMLIGYARVTKSDGSQMLDPKLFELH